MRRNPNDTQDASANLFLLYKNLLPEAKVNFIPKAECLFTSEDVKKDIERDRYTLLEINTNDVLGNFINSSYNKDGDSYRSPWSNTYFPNSDNAKLLPKDLRQLEIKMNNLVKDHTKLYYNQSAVSSVYVELVGETLSSGFICAILIKNTLNNLEKLKSASLDSICIVKVSFVSGAADKGKLKAQYNANCKMIYNLVFDGFSNCSFKGDISTESVESITIKEHLDNQSHCENIGNIFEEKENIMRRELSEICFKNFPNKMGDIRNLFYLGKNNCDYNILGDLNQQLGGEIGHLRENLFSKGAA
ncbi:MAG: F-actin-capping protein subunit beta [archaeon]|nr:F-actin-capping protein subunit beta [archaeon]